MLRVDVGIMQLDHRIFGGEPLRLMRIVHASFDDRIGEHMRSVIHGGRRASIEDELRRPMSVGHFHCDLHRMVNPIEHPGVRRRDGDKRHY